jgi:glycosyltransferase involved in cell wall biosynthesis
MMEETKACVAQWGQAGGEISNLFPKELDVPLGSCSTSDAPSTASRLRGKRVAMVAYSEYPLEPRTRRTVDALIREGMRIDLICLGKKGKSEYTPLDGLHIRWCPIVHRRDSKLAYFYNYAVFTIYCAIILAIRSLKRPYDIVYIHNMPDVLVLSGLFPKALGSKLVFDIHDPMPELMMTISKRKEDSFAVRILQWIEKWSIERSHLVVTTNIAFKRAFAARSCPREEIGVVMNSPDEQIFPFRRLRSTVAPNGVPSKRFVIMYHGSIVKRSGLDLAIDAFARVRKSIPTAELRIFGRETPFLLQEMERVRKMGLEGQVHYFGGKTLEELVHEIENCDVGIIPNAQNAFTEINMPTRIFEFLTMGKPAIGPDTIGVRDYFTRDSLIFFGPGNAVDLARKIEQVAFHYSDALETVRRGQDVYLAHKWSQEKQTLANLLDHLLNGGKAFQTNQTAS